ncbi:hypothetical protein RYA05_04885 [Pseudomonas syringae pv. actinidiae]|nr:hypothetical protein [Pseudomonas syringae pv. actinidiae]
MRKVGVCCFDDPSVLGHGWASVAGGETLRVNGFGELRSDVLWVLNINFRDLTKIGLNKTNHLYDEQYFRISLRQLSLELGLSSDPDKFVRNASEILDRVARLGFEMLGVDVDNPGYRYSNLVGDKHMPDFCRKKPQGPLSASILDATRQSTQENQAIVGRYAPSGSTAQGFIFPRGSYGRWMLSQQIPSCTSWTEFKMSGIETVIGSDEGAIIRGTAHVVEKLMTHAEKNALFLKVNVESMDRSQRPYCTFGAGANYPRTWATLPEVLSLLRYAKVRISEGFMTPLRDNPLASKIDLDINEVSFARGVLLENLWIALASPVGTGMSKKQTPVGAYLRAYDRAVCQKSAQVFEDYQFPVGSYGVGRVMVYLRAGEIPHASELALQNNMMPTISILQGRK